MVNQQLATEVVVQKFRNIAVEYKQNSEQIEGLQKRQAVLELMAQDCYAAARLFGFDLAAETAVSGSPASIPEDTKPQNSTPLSNLPAGTIRDMVLEEAQAAYPEPVRATPLRVRLEQRRGESLHEKTIGMTLYRLSKDGLVTRKGRDWFFVPKPTGGLFE